MELGGCPQGQLCSRALPPQKCLVQVAFRPVLPSEMIRQQAFQALSKDGEVKLVSGGAEGRAWGSQEGLPASCTKGPGQTPPPLPHPGLFPDFTPLSREVSPSTLGRITRQGGCPEGGWGAGGAPRPEARAQGEQVTCRTPGIRQHRLCQPSGLRLRT